MSRFIWCLAGLCMAAGALLDAIEGPKAPLAWVDPTAWVIIFLAGMVAWLWLALDAARGSFE